MREDTAVEFLPVGEYLSVKLPVICWIRKLTSAFTASVHVMGRENIL